MHQFTVSLLGMRGKTAIMQDVGDRKDNQKLTMN